MKLNKEEKIEFIDSLYWTDFGEKEKENPNFIKDVFQFLKGDLSIEELSLLLKLYNNPSGYYTKEFGKIIVDKYLEDKSKFFKALKIVKDEAINLVYIFRQEAIFKDEAKEIEDIEKLNLMEAEKETAYKFFSMYRTICSTWV